MSRVVQLLSCLCLGCFSPEGLALDVPPPDAATLWYEAPAGSVEEALPLGNGSLGALVSSDPNREEIRLGLDRLWVPPAVVAAPPPAAAEALAELRQDLFEGADPGEIEERFRAQFGSDGQLARPAALARLEIEFPRVDGAPLEFHRQLRLLEGVLLAHWRRDSSRIVQQVFASHPDQVLVIDYQLESLTPIEPVAPGERPGPVVPPLPRLDLDVGLIGADDGPRRQVVEPLEGVGLRLAGVIGADAEAANSDLIGDETPGLMRYETQLLVLAPGGRVEPNGRGGLAIRGAERITLLVAADSSFGGVDPRAEVAQRLGLAGGHGVEELRRRHEEDFRALMGRVELEVACPRELGAVPTPQRLARFERGAPDAGLLAQLFHYGRYLLISSSRPGSLPPSMRGLWSDAGPSAGEAYDLSGSLPLAYALSGPCGLPECQQPLLELAERLRNEGGKLAAALGEPGWCAPAQTDPWGRAALISGPSEGWIQGGATLLQPLWEQWSFGGDAEFLRQRLFPLLVEQSRFYLDWLETRPGGQHYLSLPDRSPGSAGLLPLSVAPAASQQLIADVLDRTLEAAHRLGETDRDLFHRLHELRSRLGSGLQLDEQGQLRQGEGPLSPAELAVPHLAPLHALYPSDALNRRERDDLETAAFHSLRRRLEVEEIESCPWMRAWALAQFARLHRAGGAANQLLDLADGHLRANLLMADDEGPQLAANLIASAGLAECVIQSHHQHIELLPALPPTWARAGRIRGLRARGGFVVDFSWENGQVVGYDLWHADSVGEPVPMLVNGQSVQVRPRPLADRR